MTWLAFSKLIVWLIFYRARSSSGRCRTLSASFKRLVFFLSTAKKASSVAAKAACSAFNPEVSPSAAYTSPRVRSKTLCCSSICLYMLICWIIFAITARALIARSSDRKRTVFMVVMTRCMKCPSMPDCKQVWARISASKDSNEE